MDEEVNADVGELWHAWKGTGAAGLPRGGQGEPVQTAVDGTGSVGKGMAKTGWDISPGRPLEQEAGQGTAVAPLETESHGWAGQAEVGPGKMGKLVGTLRALIAQKLASYKQKENYLEV